MSPYFKRTQVFLSYSHSDRYAVAKIGEYLAPQLFDVFRDNDRLYPGWTWESRLLDAVGSADVFVLIIGQDTFYSAYVYKELNFFLARMQQDRFKTLLPVVINDSSRIPAQVRDTQYLDLSGLDGQARARIIGQAIWSALFIPTGEQVHHSEIVETPTVGGSSPASDLEEKWDTGQIWVSPQALAQMINLGIQQAAFPCSHRELNISTHTPRLCSERAVVVCASCTKGACLAAFHLYGRYCTVLGAGELFSLGTKIFYWCDTCRCPVCTHCLEVDEEYPCSPEDVLSYRFHCPACTSLIHIVPVLNSDMNRVAGELAQWSKAGGPPKLS